MNKQTRGLGFYLVLGVLIIGAWWFITNQVTTNNSYTYQDFVKDVDSQNITKVAIHPNNAVPTGQVVLELKGGEQRQFYVSDVVKVEEYLEGKRQTFELILHPEGTEFQKAAWQALMEIPYGETRTYKQQAESIGKPKALRAIGMANHRNPIPIFIPCHRVIASNGTLGGYSGGVERKRYLLQREGVSVPEPKPRKPRRKREVGAH